MTVFLIVLFSILIIFLLVIYFFFSLAFVKRNIGNTDDLDDPINKPLQNYKSEIKEGIDFLENEPYKWIHTESLDGLNLAARYFDYRQDKTIILFHGYRSSAARDFSCAIKMYKELGFNILLCDQRSHGLSEGRLITFGIKESDDVKIWAELVAEKFRPKSIILSGMSMGATTVLLSLSKELPAKVKGVIADSGFTTAKEIILKVAKQYFKINAKPFMPLFNLYCKILGGFSLNTISTEEAVNNSVIPILFIHGKADSFVPYEMSVRAYKNANLKSRILLVENAEHGLSYLVDKTAVEEEVQNFIKICDL